jgi:hypothetical protein
MTRFLSEILQAPEPYFRLGLRQLEKLNGNPGEDIRLTHGVQAELRQKILELGLDPNDTTSKELYHALLHKVQQDDQKLIKTLRTRAATYISAEGNVEDGLVHALQSLTEAKDCFALKSASFKALMKKIPPKKAMKQLGYRSLTSFLKHENPATILTVAAATEDDRWQQQLLTSYKNLKQSDFENRPVSIVKADSAKWHKRIESSGRNHAVLAYREIGAIVILPIPKDSPAGIATASLSLALQQLNEIQATSAYLKMSQVRTDFGSAVQLAITDEISLNSAALNRDIPWNLVHRFYQSAQEHFDEAIFEPHLRVEDMSWESIETLISQIEPSLSFWRGASHIGMQHNNKPVSLNLIDVVLNLTNNSPFEQRLVSHFQKSLWHELLLKYLNRETIEQTILRELQPTLAPEYETVS